ncbi:hypothetical protein K439DRAFT_1612814 [Ramaria rubella]|nr:hypothetical protein K439DRAFT_1612814 [Ramaria rubella]
MALFLPFLSLLLHLFALKLSSIVYHAPTGALSRLLAKLLANSPPRFLHATKEEIQSANLRLRLLPAHKHTFDCFESHFDYLSPHNEGRRWSCIVSAIIHVTLCDGVWHEDVGYGVTDNVRSKGDTLDKVHPLILPIHLAQDWHLTLVLVQERGCDPSQPLLQRPHTTAPHLNLTTHSCARTAAAAARALVNLSWTLSLHLYPTRPHPFVPALLHAPKSQAVLTATAQPPYTPGHTPPPCITVSQRPMPPTPPGAAWGSTPPSTVPVDLSRTPPPVVRGPHAKYTCKLSLTPTTTRTRGHQIGAENKARPRERGEGSRRSHSYCEDTTATPTRTPVMTMTTNN